MKEKTTALLAGGTVLTWWNVQCTLCMMMQFATQQTCGDINTPHNVVMSIYNVVLAGGPPDRVDCYSNNNNNNYYYYYYSCELHNSRCPSFVCALKCHEAENTTSYL